MRCRLVIPARYGSARLPGKPLLPIAGRPMIAHVCERALEADCGDVVVATDDPRIAEAVAGLPVAVMMTRPDHASGSERIAEVAKRSGWDDEDLILNLQGDEPFMPPELIRRLATEALTEPVATVVTLAAPICEVEEVFNPNNVKVVVDNAGYALYFSRAPIPYYRDGFTQQPVSLAREGQWLRHIGIYTYRVWFMRRYTSAEPSGLEILERLEQLRILAMGEKIRVITVDQAPQAGIDTADDLARIRASMSR